jgi:hypothetical protein
MKTLPTFATIAAIAATALFAIPCQAADLNSLWHGRWMQSASDLLTIDADKFQMRNGSETKNCLWSKDGKAPSTLGSKGCWATYEGKVMSKDFANQEVAGADEQTRELMKLISANETFKSVQVFDAAPATEKPNCTWRYIYDKAVIYKKGDCKVEGTVMLVLQKYAKQ